MDPGLLMTGHGGVALKAVPREDSDQEFEELLLMLKETRGFDFTGYKRPTLMRRVVLHGPPGTASQTVWPVE